MRRNRWGSVWAAMLCVLLCGCSTSTDYSRQHTVALVAKSTQTEFWLSVFAGAEAAATEYNLKLTIIGPNTEEDYETQNQMVSDAVNEGAEAIVFSAIDYENNAAAIDAAAQNGVALRNVRKRSHRQQRSFQRGEHLHWYGQLRRRTDGGAGST